MIHCSINGIQTETHKNLTVLQVCKNLKIDIPKFCFQENLQIAGNCRMCLVEIENSPKPVASCAMPITNNMKIFTNTPLVQKARESVLEFLLINHPLDCPICDQASECDLQDQTMLFGSDRNRFFLKKRSVENKNCGPFIKTIMTRCIHCTRCVRFVTEICGTDELGTTGRGNKTEINFYKQNIFNSEFSGNLIDLCPVGALTSKPFTFKARSWELQKKEGVDILDSIGSNINIDLFNNEVVRILPKTNENINKEWIANKTRFFFDSLKYQRIEYPLLKKNNKFQKITWFEVFNILTKKVIQKDSSKIQTIIGDLIELKSLFLLKRNLNLLGIYNIFYEKYLNEKPFHLNSNLLSTFLFNDTVQSINSSDVCLIINSDIRKEGSILNLHLINRLQKGNFKIFYIGKKTNFTYPVHHLGTSLIVLLKIIIGKHQFCTQLKKAKNPLIIVGENIMNQKNGYLLIQKLRNFSFLNEKVFFFNTKKSLIHFFEINFSNVSLKTKRSEILYLFNTNLKNKLTNFKTNFLIYQGHHFTDDAQKSDLIIPGLSFLEKKGTYINFEGFVQKNTKILNLQTNQKDDSAIFKYLHKFFLNQNQSLISIKQNSFSQIFPYLKGKKKLIVKDNLRIKNRKIFTTNIRFLNSFFKNFYSTNILEQFSKLLINSNKLMKKQTNFFK